MRAFFWASLALVPVVGCQCHLDDNGLTDIPDAGFPDAGTPPPPPTFPLKVGDSIKYPDLGGRTQDNCDGHGTPGDCQRNLSAQYDITDVNFDEDSNRWKITANATYIGSQSDLITAAALAPLVLENAAPFATTSFDTPTQAEDAVFTTDAAATDQLTPNGFPFLQYVPGSDEDGAVFEGAGNDFCGRYRDLDADANCRSQLASGKMEVFYKDDQAGGGSKLHKVSAEYHSMGLVCGWDESLIPFLDSTPRDQTAFNTGETPDLVASFFSPSIIRDGKTYQCSCFTQVCSTGNGADKKCLSTDPDAAPGPCP